MKKPLLLLTLALSLTLGVSGQKLVSPVIGQYRLSDADLIKLTKAEDARDAEPAIAMFTNVNTATRYRAALAAGRIGDEKALDGLVTLLSDGSVDVRAMAAFAIGEIESVKGADAVLNLLKSLKLPHAVRARAVEAAGKIAAANAKDPKAKELGEAIVTMLNTAADNPTLQDREVILLGITAALRARPEKTGETVAKFLSHKDARIRADACNTLARVRAKNANSQLRKMVVSDPDAVSRANAARALGAAEDKGALSILLKAATTDRDPRVRISAIRAVGSLKEIKAADRLIERAEQLFAGNLRSRFINPVENSELIEISTVLGRLLAGSGNEKALKFLDRFAVADSGLTPEISLARISISPGDFDNSQFQTMTWHELSTDAQLFGALATIEAKTDEAKKMKQEAEGLLFGLLATLKSDDFTDDKRGLTALPDVLGAYAKFKSADLDEVLRIHLEHNDVFVRAAAAGLIAEQPASKENIDALKKAFADALVKDKVYNDAQLSILDALYKLNKNESVGTATTALSAADQLVRKKAFEMLADKELQTAVSGIAASFENARKNRKDQVLPFNAASGTKLGQVLNNEADYRRALSRKNGTVKALLKTEKGLFTIVFYPEDAPLTVDNWVKLARSGYFNGLEVHRVVPNFVMQDGDPRGDGNGGPGWSIRCEVNMREYDRGAVGMALSGKDTGGSQWFVTHSPQPHLDGGYTVFGHVNETDMKVVDKIVRGDKILKVTIVGK